MKTILFDLFYAQPLGNSKFHGGGEYIKKVFFTFVDEYLDDIDLIVFYNFDKYIDDWIKNLIKKYKIKEINISNISEINRIFLENKIDIFYTGLPYEYREEMFPKNVFKIATFHGMRAVECPHDVYEYKYTDKISNKLKENIRSILKDTKVGYAHNVKTGINNYKKCFETFDKIFCVSEHTKYSILNYCQDIRVNNIDVLYPPLKVKNKKESKDDLYQNYGEYILILGANRWLKNAYRGIKAIDDLYSRNHLKNIKTVVVGGLSKSIYNEIVNKDKFVFLNYVDTNELEILYKQCKVFLYPTLNEGFGYPPLEAMAYGKTCIVSAVCSLPEICGDAVYYVNPFDIGEMQNRIIRSLEHPIISNKVIEQYNNIEIRQKQDLSKLCEFIIGDN